MLEVCRNSRDRALLYETGARIGEIGSMRVKDVNTVLLSDYLKVKP